MTNANNMMLTEKSLTAQGVYFILDRMVDAAIVGGGPAGLATALMLAKRGWKNIIVLEKRPSADYYEPDKSFFYQIDGRGQKFSDFIGLTDQLAKLSVPNTEFYLTVIRSNGKRKTSKLPITDPNRKTAYWLPRRAFLLLLYQEIERNWQHCITVLFNTDCVEINRIAKDNNESELLQIIGQGENGKVFRFEPRLLVGCDGINSMVRQTLSQWDESDRFKMKQFPSPSAGLRYKVLTIPPKFPLDRSGSEYAVCNMAYAIRGAFKGPRRSVSLGLLPMKNPDEPRTANIITRSNHEIRHFQNRKFWYNKIEKI